MVRRVLVTAALLLALPAPAAAQSVKAGIEAWQRSDYSAAVAIWRPLAEKGDADAAFNLGQAYRLGRGVPTNLSIAKSWFERAAHQNHVDAQTTLGLLLFQNAEQAEGLKWLKAAAEQGEARALLVYGTALFNGDGVTQDQVLGYAYVSRAAAQGLGPAKETLAQLDSLMPLDQRKKGVAIAKAKAKAAPPPPSAKRVKMAKPVEVAAVSKPPLTPAPSPAPSKPTAKPKPATPAPVQTVAASGAWRIQVGAFNNRAAAESAYGKLADNAALAGRSPQYIPFNQFIRLRIGPFASKQSAAAACSALRTACFPVPPGK
jgi:cell division septation protein DedD